MKKLFVVGLAALLLVAFAVPAMADVKIGGIIFTDFYYINRDKNNLFNPQRGTGLSYTNTAIQVPNITRLYGRWTNEDNVGMYIEFGLGQGGGGIDASSSDDQNSAVVRHAYGWWDVNPMFQIMAGHSTTPFSPLNPEQLLGTRSGSVNIIGVGYGDYYAGRFAQVRGTFNFAKVAKLEIALVDPNGAQSAGGQFYPTGYTANNTLMPRVDVSVPIYLGPVHLYPGILWQRRGVDGASYIGHPVDSTVTTWIATIGTKMGFGPFAFSGEFNYGENWGNTRGLAGYSQPARVSSASLKRDGAINNAETYSWWVDLAYKFGPITPNLIYGQMKTKNKAFGTDLSTDAKSQMYGISVPIDLAKGFRLRPELMWYDDGDYKTDTLPSQNLGKYMIAGVQFQITF
ncbi:MAG: Porin [Thermodesulfobacteriota bacterium]|nr:Porin [Thermodesulfobacteriota bacterium]